VLVERGLAATTMADVAAAAAAKGTVYLYFESKAERLVATSYDFALANHALHHVLFHEAGFGEADAFARAHLVLAELVEAGRSSGEIELADPELATEFCLRGLHGMLVAATHRPRSQRRRLVAGVTELICQALGVRTAGTTTTPPGPGVSGRRRPSRRRER
jgi:AcrR family transcriptional regulator